MFRSPTGKGAGLILLSSLVFCLMSVVVRLGNNLNAFQLTFFRCAVGLAILGAGALLGLFSLHFVDKKALLMRGTVGGVATYFAFLGIVKLGIAKGTLITYSYPIFTAIFSFLILKERMSLKKIFCIFIAFAGLVLLSIDGIRTAKPQDGFVYEPLIILGAALSGLAVVFVKKLHDTDSTHAIFFAQCLGGFWIVIFPAGHAASPGGHAAAIILILSGLLAATGQLLMTEGYKTLSATTGALITLLVPAMSMALGALLFNEPFSSHEISGSLMILAACATILTEPIKKKAANPEV